MVDKNIVNKFNIVQEEILRIGWKGIVEKYHPDVNMDHECSWKLFELYKEIYANMQKRMVVNGSEGDEKE